MARGMIKTKEITIPVGEGNVGYGNELSQLVGVNWCNNHFRWQFGSIPTKCKTGS